VVNIKYIKYSEYAALEIQVGAPPEKIISHSAWAMLSYGRQENIFDSMKAQYNMLNHRVNTSFAHYMYLQERIMKSGRVGMMNVYATETAWDGYTLAFKVEQIANLENMLGLPSSQWSEDTPTTQTDVVAW